MNVSLPESLKAFVDLQVETGGYGTSSEYIRELIRRDQERLRLRGLLLDGARSLRAAEPGPEYFASLRAKIDERAAKAPTGEVKPLVRRAAADRDVESAIDYYLEQDLRVAHHFVDTLEAAYAHIGRYPSMGSPRYAHALDLPGLRMWPIERFPYLVFYFEAADATEFWSVLHAAADLPDWLHGGDRE